MDMKKNILLSMILLALCLIQASADNYFYKIRLYKDNGQLDEWSNYIEVSHDDTKGVYVNGLGDLIAGKTVKDEGDRHGNGIKEYTLPQNAKNEVDLDKIWGIQFANGIGRDLNGQSKIMQGAEYYTAWKEIQTHIKYLGLRDYKLDAYNNSGYFMGMHNVEELELPKEGMNVGNGAEDGQLYFANAYNLKTITIWSGEKKVDITDDAVKDKTLLNIVGKKMFSNCYGLSTKYINRLIKNVTEIKDNAFYADDENRDKFSDEEDNTMPIEIPSSVTKIGSQAFYNRVKVTGLIIHGNGGSLEIGSQAFRRCEQLHTLNLDNAKITYLGTGVFGDCRSMTNEFVNGVLTNYAANGGNYAANGGKKIPAYLFFGCNGQDGHDGTDPNKHVCSFTDLNIPAQFTEIGDGAFASTGDAKIKLKTITVNSEKAPTCLQGETDEYANIKNKSVFADRKSVV